MRVGSEERHLFIVSREAPGVAQFLREQFPPDSNVSVLLDRRHGERRRDSTPTAGDRRGPDRRQRPEVVDELRRHTHAFVTVTAARLS
jgi:hypothetical protein